MKTIKEVEEFVSQILQNLPISEHMGIYDANVNGLYGLETEQI